MHVGGADDPQIHVGASFWLFETHCQFLERESREWPVGVWGYALPSGGLCAERDTAAQNLMLEEPQRANEVVGTSEKTRQWVCVKDLDWDDLAHDVELKEYGQAFVGQCYNPNMPCWSDLVPTASTALCTYTLPYSRVDFCFL